MQELLRIAREDDGESAEDARHVDESGVLANVAGTGIVDSGCGRVVCGEDTLERHEALLQERVLSVRRQAGPGARFIFGNESRPSSLYHATTFIGIGGRHGTLTTHVIPGTAPILVSKGVLKALRSNSEIEPE